MYSDDCLARVLVNGVVQGVGFRPFVYRAAVNFGLGGFVRNLGGKGVEIVVEGSKNDIKNFLKHLKNESPPLSEISEINVDWDDTKGFDAFEIKSSSSKSPSSGKSSGGNRDRDRDRDSDRGREGGVGVVPPDTAVCGDCLDDIFGGGRFGGYWATSCVNCGPRFTVVKDLPYDRENTSFEDFELCGDCRKEYGDPGDRRYHAQTIACSVCGPEHFRVPGCSGDPLRVVAEDVLDGDVVGVKGAGGTHLVCLAREREVGLLRERLGRDEQPFAVMAPSLESVGEFACFDEYEESWLTSIRRPIVLLDKKEPFPLSDNLAPGLHNVGVMLPYSGTHHLLFRWIDRPVVMTSGNIPGRPMHIQNEEIVSGLEEVVDSFLLHNRGIVNRCDDSVLRMHGEGERFIRRSRGFVPDSLDLPVESDPVLGFGSDLDTTVAVGRDGECIVSQYIGDLDNPETFSFYKESIESFLDLAGVELPDKLVCDLHPDYRSSKYAEELGDPLKVQHHHAHIASVLAEHNVNEAVGLAVDGAGYGDDGSIWGGEVLYADQSDYTRIGGLSRCLMPGGDKAALYPSRMVAGILYPIDKLKKILDDLWFPHGEEEINGVLRQLEKSVNVYPCSSAGRFLDAVSALLGVCYKRTYEGEPAMKLESLAKKGESLQITPKYRYNDRELLDIRKLLIDLIELMDNNKRSDIAKTAHTALAKGLGEIALKKAREQNVNHIAVSGGVAYNEIFMKELNNFIEQKNTNIDLITNREVPPGDGGVSYGQVVVGSVNNK